MAVVPSPVPAVSLQDAVALAGRFPLLAGCDLELAHGETVLVEGANGAGKTSLLRVCAGLVPLSSGRARVLGLDPVRHQRRLRRQVGLLAHDSHLYDDLTVAENLRFAVRAAAGDVGRIEGAAHRFGLVGRLARTSAGRLSAGQRRRVALAVMTARWPDLWLLDEPHAGLDAVARRLLDELLDEVAASGATVVVASHETAVVEARASRVVTMQGGRVTGVRTCTRRAVETMAAPAPAPVVHVA
jgi:ABC-2 type transport system ATP-binding protein